MAGPKAPVESENQRAVTRAETATMTRVFPEVFGYHRARPADPGGGQSGSRRFSAAPFISADGGHTWSDPQQLFSGRNSSTQVSLHP